MGVYTDYKYELFEKLIELRGSRKTYTGICIRCIYCGDSVKSLDHSHLNIIIDYENDDMPLIYHCFRCDEAGILTSKDLRLLEINDMSLQSGLTSLNNKASKSIKKSTGFNSKKLILRECKIVNTDLANKKLEYINNRLGTDISIDECSKFKIIPNIGELLKSNNITAEDYSCDLETLINLHKYGVGFLTCENHYVNVRNITDKGARYYKYSMIKNLPPGEGQKMYIIPTSIDILSNEKIEINITEGTFDILGVYFHINNRREDNIVYCANNGSGFIKTIIYFISQGFFGDNVYYNIYSDADRPLSFYDNIKSQYLDFMGGLTIYYNKKGKDYGVRSNEIELKSIKIK